MACQHSHKRFTKTTNINNKCKVSLPTEQLLPVYPATQSQRKSFTSSVQFPPFWHGCSPQSSMSELQQLRLNLQHFRFFFISFLFSFATCYQSRKTTS